MIKSNIIGKLRRKGEIEKDKERLIEKRRERERKSERERKKKKKKRERERKI